MKQPREIGFDVPRFWADLGRIALERKMTVFAVSIETGVNSSTLYYMRLKGQVPDGVNLAALCKWSGLDAADYSVDRREI